MCGPTASAAVPSAKNQQSMNAMAPSPYSSSPSAAPSEPSALARYACAALMGTAFVLWGHFSFYPGDEMSAPGIGAPMHSYKVPLALTSSYVVSLPLLRNFARNVLAERVNVKSLLTETMVVYNAGQVLLNGWMVYRIIDAVVNRGHPFVGDIDTVLTGATYATWIHYCDKYLEFFDTFFMVLRGRMDQVSFLHVYHHISIAWAWWIGLRIMPGGDSYFGALLNSWIHVMMYSYYTLSLLKIRCPWKKYLTQAQLLQFTSVVIYSGVSGMLLYKNHDNFSKNRMYVAHAVQVFEMVSLFVLFMRFYSKAYSKKTATKKLPASAAMPHSEPSSPASTVASDVSKKER